MVYQKQIICYNAEKEPPIDYIELSSMIITLDTSINCTALVIDEDIHVFVNRDVCLNKNGSLKKWYELCADYVTYHLVSYDFNEDFSDQEILKLMNYTDLAKNIRSVIDLAVKKKKAKKKDIYIGIESYSYASEAGHLIDLVTIGSFIRRELWDVSSNLLIVPPTKLKAEAARLTYPAFKKGKKIEYRNKEGVSGGSFNKFDMYKALVENKDLQRDAWMKFLIQEQESIFSGACVPKPIEDINDAKILHAMLKFHPVL